MNYKKIYLTVFSFLLFSFFTIAASTVNAGTAELTGWAWSSNIGYISFNCSNTASCGTVDYKVTVATTTGSDIGTLGGYAWSSNIGWIKFFGFSAANPSPTINLVTGDVTGWIRACAGTITGDCEGADRTDGWNGWIKLSDTSIYPTGVLDGSGGVTFDSVSGKILGYSWGGTNVGWLRFDNPFGIGGVVCKDCGGGGSTITAVCTVPSNAYIVSPATSVKVFPNITATSGGTDPYSYTPASWDLPEGTYNNLSITLTDSSTPKKSKSISCTPGVTVTKQVPTPGIQMWLGPVGSANNDIRSTISVKSGTDVEVDWKFNGGGIYSDCKGDLVDGSGNTVEKAYPILSGGSQIIDAIYLPKGVHKFKMTCNDELGDPKSAYVYDSNRNSTSLNLLTITVVSTKIEEI